MRVQNFLVVKICVSSINWSGILVVHLNTELHKMVTFLILLFRDRSFRHYTTNQDTVVHVHLLLIYEFKMMGILIRFQIVVCLNLEWHLTSQLLSIIQNPNVFKYLSPHCTSHTFSVFLAPFKNLPLDISLGTIKIVSLC